MSDYSYIYIVLSLILLLYSVRKRLDLLCIASICYIVYTIYCIPGTGISGQYRPSLSPALYNCVFMQLLLLIGVSLFYRWRTRDAVRPLKTEEAEGGSGKSQMLTLSFRAYTAVIVLFALANIATAGLSAFTAGKSAVWEQTNVFYVISLYGAWPSFAYGLHNNDRFVWIPSLFVELTIFFAGARAFTATVIILFLCEKGTELWKNRKGNLHIFVIGACGVLFLLVYRMIDQYIMAGDLNGAMAILKDPSTWLVALEFNEPRVIIANYDYVFTSGLRFPAGDVVYRIVDFIPGLTSLLPIRLQYPEYFSSWLMQEVNGSAGVGGTIWGESYAMFGTVGILLFTGIWLFVLIKCNRHLEYTEHYSYFIVSIGVYLAWYINRLDFNRVAQACKVMLFCYLIWAGIYFLLTGELKIGKWEFGVT